jgi:hypothetical protein
VDAEQPAHRHTAPDDARIAPAGELRLRALLFVHETHRVAGRDADAFEAQMRDGWAATLARSTDARLLWYLEQAHGTGPSYTVVTVTAVATPDALADLDARQRRGDLAAWALDVDRLRHAAEAKVLVPVPWSPLVAVDLASIPAAAPDRGPDLPLFMEDTAWPHPGRLGEYLERASTLYVQTLERAREHGRDLLELVAAFTPMHGAGRHPEVVLWQRVRRPELLLPLLRREVPEVHRGPGTWMREALDVRDRWESRLLRVATWSPVG